MTKVRVGILFGGRSAEHEISVLSARNVLAALDRTRFEPVLIGISREGRWLLQKEALVLDAPRDPRLARVQENSATVALEPRPTGGTLRPLPQDQRVDVIFPILHGPMGEDGTVQGLLELADIPYVGAGVLGSALGMDKDAQKRLLREAGVPVVEFRTLRKSDFVRDPRPTCARAAELGFPLFTKPANMGSSVGVRRVPDASALEDALRHAFEFDTKALAEAAVASAREIEVSVLGNDDPIASVPGEIVVDHADGFYSYEAKYVDEHGARLEIPALLPFNEVQRVQQLAIQAFRVLDCSGMARVDFFRTADGRYLVNEINTLPGFTAISMYPKLWEASGVSATELVTRLVELAQEHHAARHALRSSRS
ncbi:MAG: D-alanine--D-alanine ligase family protein [Myxococcota bacterium]